MLQLIRENFIKLAILLVIIIVAIFGYKRFFGATKQTAAYQTATAQTGTLVSTVSASGTVTSGNSVNITTQAAGLVNNVYVKNGDTVTKGEKIADLTLDQDSQQRLASAQASYDQAVASVNSAEEAKAGDDATLWKDRQTVLDDQDTEDLKNQGANDPNTKQPYDNLQQQVIDSALNQANKQFNVDQQKLNDADAVIAAAQAQVTAAALMLSQASATVTAPSSGVISNLTLVPGLAITENTSSSTNAVTSQSFGEISQPDGKTQATVSVSEVDAPKIQVGQHVTMTLDAFPNQTFTGEVLAINTNGAVASGVTTYPATIAFDTAEPTMYPNMAVTAQIITNVEDNVLLVPNVAVTSTNGNSYVRVLKNGQAQTVQVQTGDSNDTETVITSGLNPDDTVITGGGNTSAVSGQSSTNLFGGIRGGGFGGGGGAVIRGGGGGGRGG